MKRSLAAATRSALLWTVSAAHFFPGSIALSLLSLILPPRRVDFALRPFVRNIVRLSGADLEVRHARGFDPTRTSIFVSNHVSIFDPFFVHSSIPQHARGLELESHFRVAGYGWMMRRLGNVPVPDQRNPSGLRRMVKLAKQSFEAGISLIAFPEATRTRTGAIGRFEPGIFRLARDLGAPIVPVTIAGAYEHHRVGDWNLYPGRVVVHVHDTIEVRDLARDEVGELSERVRGIIEGALAGGR
jgi:1-acyl-sn-glycerol-3-phosphate acyltransferase